MRRGGAVNRGRRSRRVGEPRRGLRPLKPTRAAGQVHRPSRMIGLRRRSAMTTKTPRSRKTDRRPLELDPERVMRGAGRPTRSSTSDRIRFGSWSTTSLAARRCPASTKNRCSGSAKAWLRPGAISPEGFRQAVQAVRRFRAIADAMGVTRIDATATEAMRRASNGSALAAAIAAESGLKVRILTGARRGALRDARRHLGILSTRGAGRRYGRRQPRGRGGDR